MKGLRKGQFKRASTHVACRVRIHVGVGQRCRAIDVESPALPTVRARSASIGAMDDMSQKVQNANTHSLRRQIHEHAHSSRSVQKASSRGRWMKVQGKIKMRTHIISRGVVVDVAAFKVSHS